MKENPLRTARKRAGKTVREVVEYFASAGLPVSIGAVYQWETGVRIPRTNKLLHLASLYGCTVDDLIRPGKH